MSDEKFTKGPWKPTPMGPADKNGMAICSVWGDQGSEQYEADINLIATAPELYEFIKCFMCKIADDAEKLLAKARGES